MFTVFYFLQAAHDNFARLNLFTGPNRVSVDRRHHAAASDRGVDPPPGPPRGGVLPHEGRPVAELGSRAAGLKF